MKFTNVLLLASLALAAPAPIDKSTGEVVQKRARWCMQQFCAMMNPGRRDDASIPEAVPELPAIEAPAAVVAPVVEEPAAVETPATVDESVAPESEVDPVTGEPVKRARWCMQQFCAMMNPGRRDGEDVEAPPAVQAPAAPARG
ncbi:hypothetical protein HDU98_009913 [Podochytrium sp. JEL0797]|nr:hypothetical protein HDU98_009913 [Podochytrium sp. JEL0797]